MSRKGEGRTEGLAERSMNTSIAPPAQSGPDQPEKGDRSASGKSLAGNDQRKGLEKTDPGDPRFADRSKP